MSPSRSVRREIVAGFATVLLALAVVGGYALERQARAAATLRLQNQGYLPLSTLLAGAYANQTLMGTLLERLPGESDGAPSRVWITSARRTRRGMVSRARTLANRASSEARESTDRALLARVDAALAAVERTYREDEPRFEELFDVLAREPGAAGLSIERVHRPLVAQEQHAADRLQDAARALQDRLSELALEAGRAQSRTLRVLTLATAVALIVGVVTLLSARRALEPLALLSARARTVAAGDLTPQVIPARDDELGELAREFEKMVAAVDQRDRALREQTAAMLQQERLAAIGRMAAHVTHEVRNPLSSMALNAEMLGDEVRAVGEGGDVREAARLVSAIQREIDRLTSITEEYLRVARLPRPRLQREELGALVSEVTGFARLELEAAAVVLRVELGDDVPLVSLDETQLRQALLNLLRNAREAVDLRPDGPRTVTVRVARCAREGREGASITVSDAGPGIAPDARVHLFELFFTTKERGSGLGLSLTREIVRAHGGALEVTDASEGDGGGAAFVVWLPAAAASPEGVDEHHEHSTRDSPGHSKTHEAIDDEA